MRPHALLAAAATLTAACYTYYPKHVPNLDDALLVEGQPIEVTIEREARTRSCSDYEAAHHECRIDDTGELRFHYTLRTATVTYGGRTLTQAELFQLAMADYPDRVRKIQGLRGTCELSRIPTYLAIAAAIAAIGVPLFASTHFSDAEQKDIYYGGAAITAAMAALSYPVGGYACVKAKDVAGDLFEHAADTTFKASGPETLGPIVDMATAFNAKHAGGAPAVKRSGDDDGSADGSGDGSADASGDGSARSSDAAADSGT